jgi:hypothetical protein
VIRCSLGEIFTPAIPHYPWLGVLAVVIPLPREAPARPSWYHGGVLRTALDVQEYLLHLPEARAQLPRWENVRQALGAATDVREFSWHVEVALMLDRKLR